MVARELHSQVNLLLTVMNIGATVLSVWSLASRTDLHCIKDSEKWDLDFEIQARVGMVWGWVI